MNTRR